MVNSTRLIGVGIVPTISNAKIVVGDRLVFNYGEVYRVVSVKKRTPQSRVLVIKCESSGELYDKRFMDNGFWAVVDENNRYIKMR